MEELLKRLQDNHGLSEEEASKILATITDYIKEKFPMIKGAVDSLFPINSSGKSSVSQKGTDKGISGHTDHNDDFL